MIEPKSPIPTDLALTLWPAKNGGWVIEQVCESHLTPSLIGAFTTPRDMLAALNEAFYPRQEIDETWLNAVAQSTGFSRMEGQK